MRWVAYMPLRGGSRSIPGKNIRPLAGRPLFAWALGAAVESDCFDEIWVGTDSTAIREAVEGAFPGQVRLFDRSPKTCTDEASTESALLEFIENVECDVLCTIQATSPLTTAADFQAARDRFLAENADSLLTATATHRFFWTPGGKPLNYDPAARPRRQEFGGSYEENGAFYLTSRQLLESEQCRLGGKVSIHPMAPETALEIDEPDDWARAESLVRGLSAYSLAGRIKALVIDVDGTLTDGGMYYGPDGEALKKFNTRDAHGLQRLREAGIEVGVITAENSESVHARMRKLGIEHYHPGIRDKIATLTEMAEQWGVELSEIAYMGDDFNDQECLEAVGFPCCPADAAGAIRGICRYITEAKAGDGAVREVCEFVLDGLAIRQK
ncbi:MAG: N-acylneuraminate cytidylyltransferase [Gammaproteobacteria bacterium]|nr:N-acylneuraminate cytidylyltransferase [Gammaproteobacteria bacterium]